MIYLTAKGISKTHSAKMLLDQVDFSIDSGDKIGVIGINGTGKSTLLQILAGLQPPDEGQIVTGRDVTVRYLPQNPVFPAGCTLYDYVTGLNLTPDNEGTLKGDALAILNRFGFSDPTRAVDTLSGGQRKMVALAGVLLSPCSILILDEPTNHLNGEVVAWLEETLRRRKGALVMVTHDRYFLDRVCNRIVEIDHTHLYRYDSNFEGYLALKAEREAMEEATYRKAHTLWRQELEWIRRGAKARSTKQKARIQRFEELDEKKAPQRDGAVQIRSVSTRMGKKTVEIDHLCKRYGEKILMQDFSYHFLKNDRVGFVGRNGCGKSTLMKMIAGEIDPDGGTITRGSTVRIGYYAQENEPLEKVLQTDPTARVIDYIRETAEYIETPEGTVSAAQMAERFLFDGTLQHSPIAKLSGGEKRRLYLLKVLMEAPNFLILDEPTNDLDIRTLEILEDYLQQFPGIVVSVSHDRYFLDKTARRLFAFEGDGRVTQFEGSYSEYLEQHPLTEEEGAAGDGPAGNGRQEKAPRAPRTRTRRLKFTYREEKEYAGIESEIAALEERAAELDREMTACASDFTRLQELMAEKEAVSQAQLEKMERFFYLSDLAERIAAGETVTEEIGE